MNAHTFFFHIVHLKFSRLPMIFRCFQLSHNEIHLKTVERHDFGRISSKLAEIRPMLGHSAPIWVKLGQLGKFWVNLDDIRPKLVAEIQLRAFDRF
jgi:hypothetical protein